MRPIGRRSAIRARYGRRRVLSGGGTYTSSRGALGDTPVVGQPFSPAVEAWRGPIEDQGTDLPTDFLLAWISIESAGNPCSWTSLSECGVFQLEPPDNTNVAGTSVALQHPVPPCVANAQTAATINNLTSDQIAEQVRGGVAYVQFCRTRAHQMLDQYGYSGGDWNETGASFWAATKMVHVSPVALNAMLAAGAASGSPPTNWNDLVTMAPASIPSSWIANATTVGAFGQGGGSLLNQTNLLVLGALGLGLWYLWRATR